MTFSPDRLKATSLGKGEFYLLYKINIVLLKSVPDRDLDGNLATFFFVSPSLWSVPGQGLREPSRLIARGPRACGKAKQAKPTHVYQIHAGRVQPHHDDTASARLCEVQRHEVQRREVTNPRYKRKIKFSSSRI